MEPKTPPMDWETFCSYSMPYSMAIDGFVKTGPRFQGREEGGPRANFNHHEEVDRIATRATCSQVLMSVRLGLFEAFRTPDGEAYGTVYANDCDQDVCATYFILKHSWMTENAINPRLNKLVHMEDMLDTTAGAYPFPKDMPILQELAWVFQPYTSFRLRGGLASRDSSQFMDVVTNVEHRILQYLHQSGGTIPLDLRYTIVGSSPGWSLVEEIGAQARTGMLADRIRAFVSVQSRNDGNYSYSVGRMSHLIPFNVPLILSKLTEAENNPNEKWGGGNTIGGSPRSTGSRLKPYEVAKIVNECLKQ